MVYNVTTYTSRKPSSQNRSYYVKLLPDVKNEATHTA